MAIPVAVQLYSVRGDMEEDMLATFRLDEYKDGTEAPVPSSQILYNQAIVDGIAKSGELGREIEIPELQFNKKLVLRETLRKEASPYFLFI